MNIIFFGSFGVDGTAVTFAATLLAGVEARVSSFCFILTSSSSSDVDPSSEVGSASDDSDSSELESEEDKEDEDVASLSSVTSIAT